MKLTDQEKGMGLIITKCKCCGNVYKAHQITNALAYSLTPNYGCPKCQGVPTGLQDVNGQDIIVERVK